MVNEESWGHAQQGGALAQGQDGNAVVTSLPFSPSLSSLLFSPPLLVCEMRTPPVRRVLFGKQLAGARVEELDEAHGEGDGAEEEELDEGG
ncbi:unnamed protein product [Closterium sp. Naga37s-1]|nr:unnamed protein product [Closterium sp. Naga37s-1]